MSKQTITLSNTQNDDIAHFSGIKEQEWTPKLGHDTLAPVLLELGAWMLVTWGKFWDVYSPDIRAKGFRLGVIIPNNVTLTHFSMAVFLTRVLSNNVRALEVTLYNSIMFCAAFNMARSL